MVVIRVRLGTRTERIEVNQDDTIAICKHKISGVFEVPPEKFQLTLNGKDSLAEREDTKLLDLGLVSGDLIKLIVDENGVRKCDLSFQSNNKKCKNEQGVANCNAAVGSRETNYAEGCKLQNGSCTVKSDAAVTESRLQSSVMENRDYPNTITSINGTIPVHDTTPTNDPVSTSDTSRNVLSHEPMLIRESDGRKVPYVLQRLLDIAEPRVAEELLVLVLHALMMESGFIVSKRKGISGDSENQEDKPLSNVAVSDEQRAENDKIVETPGEIMLPANWRSVGCYRFAYNQRSCDPSYECHLTCVPAGSILVVHGMLKNNPDVVSYNFTVKEYVRCVQEGPCFTGLSQLSRLFKDKIAHPLVHSIRQLCGLAPMCGLLALATEIQLKILSYLNVKSVLHVSEVCTYFYTLSKDDLLWRHLLVRDFGVKGSDTRWKSLYKEKYVNKKAMTDFRHRPGQADFFNFPSHLPPRRPHMYPPGYRGGTFDLDPFAGMGVMPFPLAPVFPSMRPRCDPIFPNPNRGNPGAGFEGRARNQRNAHVRALPGFGGSGFFM